MATPAPKSTPGNMSTFNILHGFPEALVRGMRSSFLADADYHHLTQCETLDDVRLNLSETDYADALADMNTLIPTGLQKAAVEKVRWTLFVCIQQKCCKKNILGWLITAIGGISIGIKIQLRDTVVVVLIIHFLMIFRMAVISSPWSWYSLNGRNFKFIGFSCQQI